MEEDIKILEGECDCIYFENGKCQYNNGKSKCDKGQAIENLLKRYKELEEGCKTCVIREDLHNYIEELEKKDKIIDLMAEKLVEAHGWFYSEFDNYSKEDWKEYFYKKVSDKL